MLRHGVRQDDCFQNASTLTGRCLSAIKKGGAAEAASAATALGLHMFTLGEPDENLFQEVHADLAKAAKQGKGAAAKVAAAEALALCCFVAAEDEHTTLEVMEQLHGLWGKDSAKLRAAALRGWAFLFTSLSNPLSTRQLEAELAALSALLHDADVDVRAAAGEGLGLLYSSCGLGDSDFGEEEDLDDLLEEGEEEEEQQEEQQQQQVDLAPVGEQQQQVELAQNGAGSSSSQQQQVLNGIPEGLVVPGTTTIAGSGGTGQRQRTLQQQRDADVMSLGSSVSGLDMVIDRVRDLASNRGDRQRRNRRERQTMRSSFRELRSVMEDGRVREQKIKLRHGDTLIINTMEGNCMMNFLKRFIAGGFQVHLQENPFMHNLFDFSPLDARPDKLSAQEKRAFRSPCSAASKARSQARRSQRSYKGGSSAAGW
ncbi:interferon-related developmental regulator-domain-containing protein [Scenedesmus sp. NREL 46B-D3]|nr:interferon-related developmental regulator-domain-containing protein [Scenedesmus sp. NREL 46B-D3]